MKRRSPDVDDSNLDLGRFAEPSLYILVSLSEGPKHGYAIMTDLEAITGSPMGPGTLYGALARLERRDLIEPLEAVDRRRPYRLTGLGASTVRAQLERLRALTRTGLDRLGETSS
jgi:DNA-binding PadR family transcriptional regulator